MFRCIFKDVLCEMRHSEAENSVSTISSSLSSSEEIRDLEMASIGEASTSANTVTSTSSREERFMILAKEVDAPAEFLEIAGRHLLGIHDLDTTGLKRAANENMMESIVDVMARAFLRCTAHADLVMMVLDDVHMLDELSWRVVQKLFNKAGNLFIICASRPVKSYKINIDPIFWSELHEKYAKELRFSDMYLVGLPEHEILHLVSKRLGYEARDIDMFFCVDLHAKSGGMPHFATQMLDIIKKRNLYCEMENGKVGWRKDIRNEEVFSF
jgi:predicted ATPase